MSAAQMETKHMALVDAEAVQMVRDFCVEPHNTMRHPKRFTNSIIMSILYGIRTPDLQIKHMIKLFEVTSGVDSISHIFEQGAAPPE